MIFDKTKSAISLVAILTANPARARFAETDAGLVDQEERYNTETYNDKYSYRHPVGWNPIYEQSDAAVRIHAGSLNASRFDYTEEAKFFVANSVAGFSYFQQRKEDVLEQSTFREIRTNVFLPEAIYASVVADGGSFKEYGDVGCALGWGDVRKPFLEVLYWSVDHFYETKKSEDGDDRELATHTLAMKSNISLSDHVLMSISAEDDSPLKWSRPSQGYHYEYQKSSLNVDTRFNYAPQQSINLSLSGERKSEAKSWLLIDFTKAMKREVYTSELTWQQEGLVDYEVGIGYVDRRTSYQQNGIAIGGSAALPEDLSPDSSKRDELVFFATRYEPLYGDRHFMQYGLYLNLVNLDEVRHDRVSESKGQWAWEYRYTEKARVLLNTTWDVNQLTDDFPYKKRPFRPWGGGDIQFIVAF